MPRHPLTTQLFKVSTNRIIPNAGGLPQAEAQTKQKNRLYTQSWRMQNVQVSYPHQGIDSLLNSDRIRKVKCDEGKPICARCVTLDVV